MELLRVKLKRIWGICQIEAYCIGTIVIPPGNLKVSNVDGCPKINVVTVKLDCSRNRSISDDLSTLKDTMFIGTFTGSGIKPNTTSVQLEANRCMDRIATC
jgi:hypothetical protein